MLTAVKHGLEGTASAGAEVSEGGPDGTRRLVTEDIAGNPHATRTGEVLPQQALVAASLIGPPGVGKTAFALKYARNHQDSYPVVWWIPAQDPQRSLSR